MLFVAGVERFKGRSRQRSAMLFTCHAEIMIARRQVHSLCGVVLPSSLIWLFCQVVALRRAQVSNDRLRRLQDDVFQVVLGFVVDCARF